MSAIHFDAIFQYATVGIVVTDSKGRITAVNPFALHEFGYTESELLQKRVEVLIPERFRAKHVHHHDTYIENPVTRVMGEGKGFFALAKNGREFPVQISLSNYQKNGEKYVIAFINDISVQKAAEDESNRIKNGLELLVQEHTQKLTKALEKLEASDAELRQINLFQKTLLDNAGAIIISVNEKGIILTFNREAEKELGYTAAEVIGRHTPLLFHDSLLIAKRVRALSLKEKREVKADMSFLLDGVRDGKDQDDEWIYVRKDGSKFPVRLNITAIRDEQGTVRGFIGVAIDISRTKKIEVELQEALNKEKELSELKSRFVSMASHEFRTPLSTVLTSAYLIEQYSATRDQPKRQVHLQRILSSVNMLTDILNDFLSVGKIEEGKIQVRPAHINIKEQVAAVTGEMQQTLKKQQKIRYRHLGETDVWLDPSLLKHIIMNLVSNASKFSAEGAAIEIETATDKEKLTVAVKDHGIGISKEDQRHLMERFFRGANAGNIQGTGLGLHIVSKYAELMNGKVDCESELDKGTTFLITFTTKYDGYEKDTAN